MEGAKRGPTNESSALVSILPKVLSEEVSAISELGSRSFFDRLARLLLELFLLFADLPERLDLWEAFEPAANEVAGVKLKEAPIKTADKVERTLK